MTGTLWGRASSVNVQKVMWALAELDLPYTRIDAGGKYGLTDRLDFIAMNPNRRVPVWQDGDLTLWESHAIVRHLAAPGGISHDALADQWMEFTTSTLQPPFIGAFWMQVRTPERNRRPEVLEKQAKQLNGALQILNARLAKVPWLNGKDFSTAEIAAGSLMYRIFDMDWPMQSAPAVQDWFGRLSERPAFQETVMTSYDELRA